MLEFERIQTIEDFLLCGGLVAADFPASLEALKRRRRLIVDAPFAAADDFGAQLLHHRAEKVAELPPLGAVKVVEQGRRPLAFLPSVVGQLAHSVPGACSNTSWRLFWFIFKDIRPWCLFY
ncbi:MAG: hypothetical protein WCI38_10440 [Chthoniobacterales bacterium]